MASGRSGAADARVSALPPRPLPPLIVVTPRHDSGGARSPAALEQPPAGGAATVAASPALPSLRPSLPPSPKPWQQQVMRQLAALEDSRRAEPLLLPRAAAASEAGAVQSTTSPRLCVPSGSSILAWQQQHAARLTVKTTSAPTPECRDAAASGAAPAAAPPRLWADYVQPCSDMSSPFSASSPRPPSIISANRNSSRARLSRSGLRRATDDGCDFDHAFAAEFAAHSALSAMRRPSTAGTPAARTPSRLQLPPTTSSGGVGAGASTLMVAGDSSSPAHQRLSQAGATAQARSPSGRLRALWPHPRLEGLGPPESAGGGSTAPSRASSGASDFLQVLHPPPAALQAAAAASAIFNPLLRPVPPRALDAAAFHGAGAAGGCAAPSSPVPSSPNCSSPATFRRSSFGAVSASAGRSRPGSQLSIATASLPRAGVTASPTASKCQPSAFDSIDGQLLELVEGAEGGAEAADDLWSRASALAGTYSGMQAVAGASDRQAVGHPVTSDAATATSRGARVPPFAGASLAAFPASIGRPAAAAAAPLLLSPQPPAGSPPMSKAGSPAYNRSLSRLSTPMLSIADPCAPAASALGAQRLGAPSGDPQQPRSPAALTMPRSAAGRFAASASPAQQHPLMGLGESDDDEADEDLWARTAALAQQASTSAFPRPQR